MEIEKLFREIEHMDISIASGKRELYRSQEDICIGMKGWTGDSIFSWIAAQLAGREYYCVKKAWRIDREGRRTPYTYTVKVTEEPREPREFLSELFYRRWDKIREEQKRMERKVCAGNEHYAIPIIPEYVACCDMWKLSGHIPEIGFMENDIEDI